ncbi:TPA: hypothetical protein ND504_002271 [Citrobacter farmeri]|nr:hypothetical protein [Citrobacter farmeri]HCD7629437.1 hypothetical protein [Citrobacter farmeri]
MIPGVQARQPILRLHVDYSPEYLKLSTLFGVITYIINDARSGEFDDCPVM